MPCSASARTPSYSVWRGELLVIESVQLSCSRGISSSHFLDPLVFEASLIAVHLASDKVTSHCNCRRAQPHLFAPEARRVCGCVEPPAAAGNSAPERRLRFWWGESALGCWPLLETYVSRPSRLISAAVPYHPEFRPSWKEQTQPARQQRIELSEEG